MKNKGCQSCWPFEEKHVESRIKSIFDFYLGIPVRIFFVWIPLKKTMTLIWQVIKNLMLEISLAVNHTKLNPSINRALFDNGILIFWDEAKKRGIKIDNLKIGDTQTQIFYFAHHGKKYYFDRNPIYPAIHNFPEFEDANQYDDKAYFKKVLLKHHFPCPLGEAFISPAKALAYGVKLGFPLVVKPVKSSASIHITFDIRTEQALQEAITLAKQVSYQILVEQFIPGDVYRAVVLDNQLIACAKRQPGRVVGNGNDSVEKLIDQKNKHPLRGTPQQLDKTLHVIEKNKTLTAHLANQGVSLKTILQKDRVITLANKMNVSSGADVTNVTDQVHPDNVLLFQQLYKTLHLPLLGLDFICQDVAISWKNQPFAILENNSLPGVDIHEFPSAGESIPVARLIWSYVLEKLE